jgi:hypothetical protein
MIWDEIFIGSGYKWYSIIDEIFEFFFSFLSWYEMRFFMDANSYTAYTNEKCAFSSCLYSFWLSGEKRVEKVGKANS